MDDEFDVIIVGAGPAGATAAYLLAKAGLNVLVVERGGAAGSKNVSGGLIYTAIYNEIYPRFWEQAPVERAISGHSLVFLGKDNSVSMDVRGSTALDTGLPCNAYSVLRAKFDPWLAEQAEAAGATLICSTTVDSLIVENGRVVGIQAGPDKLMSRVVIDAEGSRGLLLQHAGLRGDYPPQTVSLGVKEVIQLPADTINKRFRCTTEQGAALTLAGHTGGLPGGGFIYTNRDSLSVGVVLKIKSLYASGRQPHEILDEFKAHPFVASLIEGGEAVEYSAQTVHAGGLKAISRLYGDGYVVAGSAARLLLNSVLALRGMDLAVVSGAAAAQAIIEAHQKGDYSAATLAAYETHLKASSAYHDMQTFQNVYPLMDNPRMFEFYPNLICDVAEDMFAVKATPAKKAFSRLKGHTQGKVSLIDLAKDMWAMARGLVL